MPLLEVSGLSKRFGALRAVNDVSFDVAEGEILGLIGPNGSGKSTTFNCIAGLYAPSGGSIRFEDADISGLPPTITTDQRGNGYPRTTGPNTSVDLGATQFDSIFVDSFNSLF